MGSLDVLLPPSSERISIASVEDTNENQEKLSSAPHGLCQLSLFYLFIDALF